MSKLRGFACNPKDVLQARALLVGFGELIFGMLECLLRVTPALEGPIKNEREPLILRVIFFFGGGTFTLEIYRMSKFADFINNSSHYSKMGSLARNSIPKLYFSLFKGVRVPPGGVIFAMVESWSNENVS